MKMSKEEYRRYSERHMPRSALVKNSLNAFWTGGLVCCLGQLIYDMWIKLGLAEQTAAGAESVCLIFLGALFTGLGIFDDIAAFAGAGVLVPITGFANSVTSPALEFKTEGFITGVGAKMFTIAGPVIVYGTTAGMIYGIILCLMGQGG